MPGQGVPQRVFIHEVAPRDGLQIEACFVPTARKIALIDELTCTGLAKIEATSFSSPKSIPSLADAQEVMASITRAWRGVRRSGAQCTRL